VKTTTGAVQEIFPHQCATHDDLAALVRMEGEPISFGRRAIIATCRTQLKTVFLVGSGCVVSYVDLPCGRTFYPQFFMPGDFAPARVLVPGNVRVNLMALNKVTAIALDRDRLFALLSEQTSIYPALMQEMLNSVTRCGLHGTVTNFGDARSKVIAFLGELWYRLGRKEMPEAGDTIPLGMTQTEIGLINGLSKAHTSRTFSELETSGILTRTDARVTILDPVPIQEALLDLKGMGLI